MNPAITAAYDRACVLVAPETATVLPGSWTPARCEFWRGLPTVESRQRFERWVFAEKNPKLGYRGFELPKVRDAA
jgi:hypothetical protein